MLNVRLFWVLNSKLRLYRVYEITYDLNINHIFFLLNTENVDRCYKLFKH